MRIKQRTVGVLLVTMALATMIGAQDVGDAGERYEEYLGVLEEATELDEIFPYWAGWFEKRKAGGSADEKQENLKRLQNTARDFSPIKLLGSSENDGSAALSYSASTGDGLEMSGTVKMVREKDSWRIEEERWVMAQ